ncbi:MAG: acyltransferase [Promethearchaeota archaeon]|nr:MAG: acyltransferase [Candidatus Lokiarchaeota archaeon]
MKVNDLSPSGVSEGLERKKNYFQIDFLKAIMIAFVIIDHGLGYTFRFGYGLELWERTAIPIFLIILGFNMGKSFSREENTSLKTLYSLTYFKKKFWRFIFPYIIFYIISTSVGFIIYGLYFPETFNENWILEYIIFQKTLLEGPGNWFIPVLFQSILLMPLLYYLFSKKPILALIMCFIIEICMHLFIFFYVGPITSVDDFLRELPFRYIIFLYLSAIGMGIWFSQNHNLFSRKNLFVWLLFPISLTYMILWDFFGFRLQINGSGLVRGDYNYLTFLYSAFIFLIALRLIPKNPKAIISKAIYPLGRATFHIYLVQDLYYIILYINFNDVWISPGFNGIVNPFGITAADFLTNLGLLIINWIICFSIGVIWWYSEKKFLALFWKHSK